MIVKDAGKNRRVAVVLGIVLLLLQLGVAPNIGLFGGRANLALVFVGATCLGGDSSHAPILGFVAGLVYDLAGSGPIGLMALLLTLVGWLMAASERSSVADDPTGSLVLFALAAAVVTFLYATVLMVLGLAGSFVDTYFLRALPELVLDCVCFGVVGVVLSHVGTPAGGMSFGGKHGHGKGGSYSLKRRR